ncbi:hypothetical protein, conserved [Plasmodium gonderi]|uniref:Uncharacterized protein n=1 Tax=Plasmodium gonderi TaxID=77519 RepID=A0A1Y1J9S9_PLAGO|nr:hypothetical protein, conserved [Plasmodium gonderi]GAW79249.1 hypothetical protein, conserved [Plasmodium gonderi]
MRYVQLLNYPEYDKNERKRKRNQMNLSVEKRYGHFLNRFSGWDSRHWEKGRAMWKEETVKQNIHENVHTNFRENIYKGSYKAKNNMDAENNSSAVRRVILEKKQKFGKYIGRNNFCNYIPMNKKFNSSLSNEISRMDESKRVVENYATPKLHEKNNPLERPKKMQRLHEKNSPLEELKTRESLYEKNNPFERPKKMQRLHEKNSPLEELKTRENLHEKNNPLERPKKMQILHENNNTLEELKTTESLHEKNSSLEELKTTESLHEKNSSLERPKKMQNLHENNNTLEELKTTENLHEKNSSLEELKTTESLHEKNSSLEELKTRENLHEKNNPLEKPKKMQILHENNNTLEELKTRENLDQLNCNTSTNKKMSKWHAKKKSRLENMKVHNDAIPKDMLKAILSKCIDVRGYIVNNKKNFENMLINLFNEYMFLKRYMISNYNTYHKLKFFLSCNHYVKKLNDVLSTFCDVVQEVNEYFVIELYKKIRINLRLLYYVARILSNYMTCIAYRKVGYITMICISRVHTIYKCMLISEPFKNHVPELLKMINYNKRNKLII